MSGRSLNERRIIARLAEVTHPRSTNELADDLELMNVEDVVKAIGLLVQKGLVKRSWKLVAGSRWYGWALTSDGCYAARRQREAGS